VPLNLSFTHIMVVLVVALVVLGPERLPDAARSIAKVISELRRMSSGLQAEVHETFGEFAEPFSELVHTVTGGVVAATSAREPEPPPPADPLPAVDGAAAGDAVASSASLPPEGLDGARPSAGPQPTLPALPALPALGGGEPRPGTFSAGPPVSEPVFVPLGTPEPGTFTPKP
jgi:sec-independent protein translocase protein TatB